MLGLSVPGERAVEARQEVRMPAPELVVHAHEAHEAAHPALARRVEAQEPDQLRRQ